MSDETKAPSPDDRPEGPGSGSAEGGEEPIIDTPPAPDVEGAKAEAAADGAETEPPAKPPWEEKPVAPAHADAADDEDVADLAAALDGAVLSADRFAGDVTVTVPRERIVEVCRHLKGRGFTYLVDLTAVDWPERESGRFDIVYWMHRFDDSTRLRLVVTVAGEETVDSVAGVWKVANWMEREVWDMFGVIFDGHPNLERILTWEGFNGHPLRKDFPVEGIDTGAAIYPDVYPPGGGPAAEAEAEEQS